MKGTERTKTDTEPPSVAGLMRFLTPFRHTGETVALLVLVVVSVLLSGKLWLSLPNPQVLSTGTTYVSSKSVSVSAIRPLLISYTSLGQTRALLPPDPGFARLWQWSGDLLAGSLPLGPVDRKTVDELLSSPTGPVVCLIPPPGLPLSALVSWGPDLPGSLILILGPRPVLYAITPQGIQSGALPTESALLLASTPFPEGRPATVLSDQATPYLPVPSATLILPIPTLTPDLQDARRLVASFFPVALSVNPIPEGNGVTSYTDGLAVLRTFASGAFQFSTVSVGRDVAATDPIRMAENFISDHPSFPPGLTPIAAKGYTRDGSTNANVSLALTYDGIPILGPEGVFLSETASTVISANATLLLARSDPSGTAKISPENLLALLPAAQRTDVLTEAPVYNLSGTTVTAAIQVLLMNGQTLILPAPPGGS